MKRYLQTSWWVIGLNLMLVLALLPSMQLAAGQSGDHGSLGECMVDRFNTTKPASNTDLNCTSNDVQLAQYEVQGGLITSCEEGEDVTLLLRGEFVATSNERWDVGVFIALDGGTPNALDGAAANRCWNDFLTPVSADNTDINILDGEGPFYNGEITEDPADTCGDTAQGTSNFLTLGDEITFPCADKSGSPTGGPDGFVDLTSCTVWANSRSDGSDLKPSCSDELDTTAETTAKCSCDDVPLDIPITRTITPVVTAATSFTQRYDWEITKTATPDDHQLFAGDTGTSDYDVVVTKGAAVQSLWMITGTVDMTNTKTVDAVIDDVTVDIDGIGLVTVDCGVTFPGYVLAPAASLSCTYSSAAPDDTNRLVTATIVTAPFPTSLVVGEANTTTADFSTAVVTTINDSVDVTDTNDEFTPVTTDITDTFEYSITFDCTDVTYDETGVSTETTFPNTATITGDDFDTSADEDVTRTCYVPVVTKTVNTALERTYDWTVDKSVTPAQWDMFTGDTGTSDYTVDVTRTANDGMFVVSGVITVTNNASVDATINAVTDLVSVGSDVDATVDCGGAGPYTVPSGGGTLDCTYTAEVADEGSGTNTATGTLQNKDFASDGSSSDGGTTDFSSAAVDVIFDGGTTVTEVDETATVTDDWATPGDDADDQTWGFSGDGQQTYSITFACDADEGTRTNTVVIVGDDSGTEFDADDATVIVNCYDITVEKDALTAYTVTSGWTIDKTAVPNDIDLFTGDQQEVKYTITVDETETSDDWAVSGAITVSNPNPVLDASLVSLTDVIAGFGGAVTVDCGGETSVPAGGTLDCSYSAGPVSGPDANPFGDLNTATAELQNNDFASDGTGTPSGARNVDGTSAVNFGDATVTYINPEVNVSDSNGDTFGPFTGDDMVMYTRDFVCDADEGEHINTATIDETGASDDATVNVECWSLEIAKTAQPFQTDNFDWEITKTVNPDSWDLFTGDTGTSKYTIDVIRSEAPASDFRVEGTITVSLEDGTPIDAVINSLSDLITPGDLAATVDCGGAGPYDLVSGGADLECTYFTDVPDDATRTNTATAEQQNYAYTFDAVQSDNGTTDYSADASVNFADATIITGADDTATATDDLGTVDTADDVNWGFDGSGTQEYDRTFDCGDEGDNINTVTLVGDDSGLTLDSDDATVVVTCYDLVVTKDAETTYTREYDWDITKQAFELGYLEGDDPITALTLLPGDVFTTVYKIQVDTVGHVDSDWAVSGAIEVANPAPIGAMINAVADIITAGDIDGNPDCGVTFPHTIPAASSLACTYAADLPDGDDRTNTAQATLQNKAYHYTDDPVDLGTSNYVGDADVLFGPPSTVLDACTDVTDANAPDPNLGQACIDEDLPKEFTYAYDIAPTVEDCPELIIENTATQTEEDTGENTSDTWTITATLECVDGCTYTQGYWKTHNPTFPGGASRKANDAWLNIVPDAELTCFWYEDAPDNTTCGQNYYDVMWTAPKGNVYYNMAHQYIAAVLNSFNASSSVISDELTEAAALFATYTTPEEVAGLKATDKDTYRRFLELAGLFGDYNEGLIGPGHCDEDDPNAEARWLAENGDDATLVTTDDGSADDGSDDRTYQNDTGDSPEGKEAEAEDQASERYIPEEFVVSSYPNPFDRATTVRIDLPERLDVSVVVYDLLGREVVRLVDRRMRAGVHEVRWDASRLPSGTYLYMVRAGDDMKTGSMLLLK